MQIAMIAKINIIKVHTAKILRIFLRRHCVERNSKGLGHG